MTDGMARIVMWLALAGQYALGFVFAFAALRAALARPPRFVHLLAARLNSRQVPEAWLRLAKLTREDAVFKERERLLAGCGMMWDAGWYVLLRRIYFALVPLFGGCVYFIAQIPLIRATVPPAVLPAALAASVLTLLWDVPLLDMFRRLRAERMTGEIYIVSNQLLYLAGSSLHIHAKLMRCVPYTKTMRAELQQLLGEWYHDAEGAIRRFKLRLGTEEGLSFAETIDSLRLHESEQYYELLRERIKDYKEKLELAKESRKESSSYVLFVLAGIPIMYTFQVFIYPWVREGQKLFDAMN
ncbi:hypothetical protein ACFFSY_22830 [Paenibacillus aurantiacus]|uniref:Type II secretion system protein GspF domain-containing protein n=1 Tax=Paenibacillus aurantiacus TaxID=1936118 RepID=A0ABV5KW11_9BACL